jgi:tol-pal system protein YbgF
MPKRLVLVCAALAVFATAGPAVSQTPLPEPAVDPLDSRDKRRVDRMEKVVRELRSIVFQLRDSGRPVVVQPADTDARMAEMSQRLADLERTLQGLNGTVDTLTRDLDVSRRENAVLKSQVEGMAQRLASTEQQLAPPPPPETAAGAVEAAASDPAKDFAQARQLMLAGDYDAAEAAFAAYVQTHPETPRTPEANYWLGKTLGVRGAYNDAARAYIGAIRGWPQTSWAPDAVVELSRTLIALKKPADACQTLAEFTRRYPKAPAAVAGRAAAARTQAKCAA